MFTWLLKLLRYKGEMSLRRDTTVLELFLGACEGNELNKVQSLLIFDVNVNWRRDSDGGAGLHCAAGCNYGELLELLLAQTGVDVNIRNQ